MIGEINVQTNKVETNFTKQSNAIPNRKGIETIKKRMRKIVHMIPTKLMFKTHKKPFLATKASIDS